MTDRQLINFILYRAKKNGSQYRLTDPKLVICKLATAFYLAVKFKELYFPFLVRFARANQRALFKLNQNTQAFMHWQESLKPSIAKNEGIVDCDIDALPPDVKHHISYAIIEALKTTKMGFDLCAFTEVNLDISLIGQDETYEEAAIEADLMSIELEEFTNQLKL